MDYLFGSYDPMIHILYIARWGVMAIPGALFFKEVQARVPGVYKPMLISQLLLGSVVFFIDNLIYNM